MVTIYILNKSYILIERMYISKIMLYTYFIFKFFFLNKMKCTCFLFLTKNYEEICLKVKK